MVPIGRNDAVLAETEKRRQDVLGAQGKPALPVLDGAAVRLRIGIQVGEEIEIAGGTQFELA